MASKEKILYTHTMPHIPNTSPHQYFQSGHDALLLAAYAQRHRSKCASFVDLGTGQGLITRLLATAWPQAKGLGLDCQEEALKKAHQALENKDIENQSVESTTLPLQARLFYACVDLVEQKKLLHLYHHYDFLPVSCVVANPPYYPAHTGHPSPHAARELALRCKQDTLPLFCKSAYKLLEHHGNFFCIYAAKHMPYLLHTLEEHGFGLRTLLTIHSRPQKSAVWVLVGARKDAASDLHIERSLCLYPHEHGQEYSTEAKAFCPWLTDC